MPSRNRASVSGAALLTCFIGFALQEGRAQNRPSNVRQTPVQALQRMQPDQPKIQDLSLRLKQELLTLNQLRRVPPNDPGYKNVPAQIVAQNEKVLQLAATIFGLLQGSGLPEIIASQRQQITALTKNGLPERERQVLVEAGFTGMDIAALSTVIQLSATDSPAKVDFGSSTKEIASKKGTTPTMSVVKIGAGALLIGFDIGSRFIPLLNAVTAFEAITSVSSGIVLVEDGLKPAVPLASVGQQIGFGAAPWPGASSSGPFRALPPASPLALAQATSLTTSFH
jgi:hypothetical protein